MTLGGPTMLARIGVTRGIEPEGSSASLILFEKTRIGARAGSRGTCDGHLRLMDIYDGAARNEMPKIARAPATNS